MPDAVLNPSNINLTPFRQRIVSAWQDMETKNNDKQPIIKQKTYRSTLPVQFVVTDVDLTREIAVATLAPVPDNSLSFFSYGISDQIPDGFGGQIKATKTDTNQSKGKNTNGGEVVGIEAISLACVGMRLQYDPAAVAALSGLTKSLRNTLLGGAILRDPASLLSPPQFDSPANLENPWLDTWASSTTFTPQFDTSNQTPLGALDEAGEGGARSFLKSHGDPNPANKFRLPDGLVWMPEGKQGSDLIILAEPTHALTMVISGPIVLPTSTAPAIFPSYIVMDIAMKLGCFVAGGVQPNQS